jgi:Nif-specific regulatory protein
MDGTHARVTAQLLLARGEPNEALPEAKRAVSLLREAGDLYQVARSLVVLGRAEEGCGGARRARDAFAEAREIFGMCGASAPLAAIEAHVARPEAGDPETAENFDAICRVMQAVAAIRDPDRLLEAMLDVAIEHVNAERGFVVLYSGGGSGGGSSAGSSEHEVRASRDISAESAAELARVSRRILAAAGSAASTVTSDSAIADPRFRDAPSVIAHNILSVLCAPLRVSGRTLGFIYLDNRRRTTRFSAGSVRFVEAFAVQAAFALERANEVRTLETALRGARQDPALIGKSPAIQRVLQLIERAAEMDHLPVYITGENGTGKELVATMLHRESPRASRPFLRVNCAAFSESLIESELFGHERGAFTGATFARPGIFERANGGTLFLDEIGEIPQNVQIKLLRVLQELTLTRVGGSKEIRVDVRILSATNADLERRVLAGQFRPDVFYRLQGLHIHLPPLRERLSDIPDLVRHFLDGYERSYRRAPLSITREALDRLQSYAWPGNVRQLEREVHQALALALAHGNLIRKEDLSSTVLSGAGVPRVAPAVNLWEQVATTEREAVLNALRQTGWNNSRAASLLGCTEGAVRKKIRKYRLLRDR